MCVSYPVLWRERLLIDSKGGCCEVESANSMSSHIIILEEISDILHKLQ